VATYFIDQIFPPLPVRQWVLLIRKRLGVTSLQRDREALSDARLRQRSGCVGGRLVRYLAPVHVRNDSFRAKPLRRNDQKWPNPVISR
jgi:hypothetical protein